MKVKVLMVAVIENASGDILMRKKPAGSPPYKETWYIFGAELLPGEPTSETLRTHIAKQAGIETRMVTQLAWDTEVKADLDGETKQFVYLDVLCSYVSGELRPSTAIEKLEWVKKDALREYDIVPPSKLLFQKLNYLT